MVAASMDWSPPTGPASGDGRPAGRDGGSARRRERPRIRDHRHRTLPVDGGSASDPSMAVGAVGPDGAPDEGTFRLAALNDSFSEDPFFLSVAIMMIVGYTTLGALIATRTERNPMAVLVMIGAGFLLGGFTDEYPRYASLAAQRGSSSICAWLTNWVFAFVASPIPLDAPASSGASCPPSVAAGLDRTRGLDVFLLIGLDGQPGTDLRRLPGPLPMGPTGLPALEGFLDVALPIGGFALLALGLFTVAALILRSAEPSAKSVSRCAGSSRRSRLAPCCSWKRSWTGWGLVGTRRHRSTTLFFVFFTVLAIGLPGACAIAICATACTSSTSS